ncbi:ribosome assembly protein RRB1, putative [Plasmodium ovale wallikeri]|uniref:Ribosome assembly protein RRB1, putative n=2 Tax=Plasmodium ovale TaxID=36330 RepID=A0A1A8YNA0_PLAOA|nr:ribosome assembly protein RRB1, putative [Plasmodium ovale wallikeri]SBT44755.1 ribosome assembly protein RRB1, putative [Plasmodium ovale wallikeri]SBT75909.1 ribosome assembly protein RRB1, putative [Plasmodium ovale]
MKKTLDVDTSAYDILFCPLTPWPCLSFDFILDKASACCDSQGGKIGRKDESEVVHGAKDGVTNGGSDGGSGDRTDGRTDDRADRRSKVVYPIEICCVAGTQAAKGEVNNIYVIKWANMNKLKGTTVSEDEEETIGNGNDETSEKNLPYTESTVICKSIKHKYGCINRVKTCRRFNSLVSAWCDDGNVYIYEISDEIKNLNKRPYNENIEKKPLYVFNGHTSEGFSMDWNPVHAGKLLTGDNDGNVHLWLPDNTCKWKHEKIYTGNNDFPSHHSDDDKKGSIEDIQWNKRGNGFGNIFCTCSSDRSIRILDVRDVSGTGKNRDGRSGTRGSVLMQNAHTSDVNVLSWNEHFEYMLASGGDDALIKIWDIRNPSKNVAELKFHKEPITSVSWHYNDTYVLLASSLDNSISIWDLSVESEALEYSLTQYPDQLLFEHQNQNFITDAKFHPYLPGVIVSTSNDNFNIFKPCNV